MRTGLLTLAALLAVVAPAHAGTWPYEASVHAGPALAGDGVAWADGPFDGAISVKRAAAGAPPVTLFTVARAPDCDTYVEDLAATPLVTTLLVRRGRCEREGREVVANGNVIASSGTGFASCGISGHDADAGLVAVARYNCQEDPVMIHDVATGEVTDLGLVLPIGANPVNVRIAGRYVAVLLENLSGEPTFEILVWDRETGAEHYRTNADALRDGADYVIGSHHLELQADGRVLYGVASGVSTFLYGWASKAEPTLHAIPGSFWHWQGRVGFAGDAIVVSKHAQTPGAAVFGLDGTERNRFATDYVTGSLDFDGTRLAWADRQGVHDERYPFTPPPPPPPPPAAASPAPPAPASTAEVPLAKIAAIKSTSRAKSLKSFRGTATDADGDLLMVRVGLVRSAARKCQTLQRSGRLKASARVDGRCVPAAFHTATGAASWKLKLRKRLPTGRYTLWAQAVDAAGNAQTTFTKAAGNLRSFTLR